MTAEQVVARRKQLGLTQAELAERLNVTERTVQRWEAVGAKGVAVWALGQLSM